MISGIDQAIADITHRISSAPNARDNADLNRALELLNRLKSIQDIDFNQYMAIDTRVRDKQLTFGYSSSSSSGTTDTELAIQFLSQLLMTHQAPVRPAIARPFTPGFRVVPKPDAPIDEALRNVDNYLEIFEKPRRLEDADKLTDLINQLGLLDDAYLAPMPPLTRCAIQGGGAKGAAYAGTYKAMDALGVTDSTKTFCGASAGAITSFLMGLGYDAEQFKAISDGLNFQDLADYNPSLGGVKAGGTIVSQLAAVATNLYMFSGNSFHHWAKGQCAMVFGDADITFQEMKEWYEKKGLPVPEMIFLGTMVEPEGQSITFSVTETPHIRIADAVRASMSFPGAWEHINVKYGKSSGEDGKIWGRFADGGILNNYPIDKLNLAPENPAYNKPHARDAIGTIVPQNPCSYGFSLTTSVHKVDENITPATKRLKTLKQHSHASRIASSKSDEDFAHRTAVSKFGKNKFMSLMSVVKKNFVGDISTSAQDDKKREVFDRQTTIIYTEGVGTLEFTLPPNKMKLIEDSGKFAFINWYLKHRNPTLTYEEYFRAKHIGDGVAYNPDSFEGDAILTEEESAQLSALRYEGKEAKVIQKYSRMMIDFYNELTMVRKVIILSQDPEIRKVLTEEQLQHLEQFKNLHANQRLKHLSWQIMRLENKYQLFNSDRTLQINETVFGIISSRARRAIEIKLEKKHRLNQNIDKQQIIRKIHDLILKGDEHSTQQAIAIFKGQMSGMFNLMILDPSLLPALSSQCNEYQLTDLLDNLRITAHQLDQQGRVWHGSFGVLNKLEGEMTIDNFPTRFQLFMSQFTNPSLLEVAIQQRNEANIDALLKQMSKGIGFGTGIGAKHYIDPLSTNAHNKNALHICVDVNDFNTFTRIITELMPVNLTYANNGQHLLHYIIENGHVDFINRLFNEPRTSAWLKAVLANASKLNPEFRSQFGAGESLRDQIIRVASEKGLALNFDVISSTLPGRPITVADVKTYHPASEAATNSQIQQMVEQFANGHVNPKELSDMNAAKALHCLTQKNQEGKSLIERYASDFLVSPYINQATKSLITICKNDPVVKENFKEIFKVKFSDESSLLYLAVINRNTELLFECLENSADIDNAGSFHDCSSALTAAAKAGYLEIVEIFVFRRELKQLNYSRAISDKEGKNPLHYLAQNPNCTPELYNRLVSQGSSLGSRRYFRVDVADRYGKTPFDYLVENNRFDIIRQVIGTSSIDEYFNVFHMRPDGKTSLQLLVEKAANDPSLYDLVKSVSNAGHNESDTNGKTVLHYLAESTKENLSAKDFVDYLVKGAQVKIPGIGIDIGPQTSATYKQLTNVEDNNANSIFRSIINSNRYDIIQYLRENWRGWNLNSIFDLETVRVDGMSDFDYMMEKVSPDTHAELFEQLNLGLPLGMQRNTAGITKLHELVEQQDSNPKEVWDILVAGLTITSITGVRESPQDYQAQTSLMDLQNRTLLRHIIDSNRIDILTHIVQKTGNKAIGRWYLDHYFDVTKIGADGQSDLEFAFNHASPEMKNLLFSRLSPETQTQKFAALDSRGMTPLHYVALDRTIHPDAFWKIINRGQTSGSEEVYGGRTNVEDNDGKTPFRLLIDNNRIDILQVIAKQCGGLRGWWFNHYINFSVKRKDGMNDLEYMFFQAKNKPELAEFVEFVRKNTTSAVFANAKQSVDMNLKRYSENVAELARSKELARSEKDHSSSFRQIYRR